jgi:uncharacterized protein YdeI (BOF family)
MKIRKLQHVLFLLALLLLASAGSGSAQQSGLPRAPDAGEKARSYLFVSPNTRENLTLKEVLLRLNSPEEIGLIVAGRTLACRLNLRARISKTIGSWTDGVEHSTLVMIKADEATARYADAWLGQRARQKSVLYFQRRAMGSARMYVLSTRGGKRGLASIAGILNRNAIENRTLVPGGQRTLIYVIDLADELRGRIVAAARQLRARYYMLRGTATFIGDDSDREKAQAVFLQVIEGYEKEHPPPENDCASGPVQSRFLKKSGAAHAPPQTKIISIAAARSLTPGATMTIEGSVTVPSGAFKSSFSDDGFALQDSSGGIYVSLHTNLGLRVGRRVRVTGKLVLSNGLLRIEAAGARAVKVRGRGPQVQPLMVKTGQVDETTEGRLLKVTGTITRSVVADAPYGFRLFVDDGTGELQVYVSTSSKIDLNGLQPGQRVTVTGIGGHYKDHYELDPRFPADIEKQG